ncbi:hypothetical protein ACQ4PT_034652 [Festuca glaucescens]
MDGAALDEVARRLVEGGRGGCQVQLSEPEIRQLCVEAKRVFLSQPNLLRIHAPVKICGEHRPQGPTPLIWVRHLVRYRASPLRGALTHLWHRCPKIVVFDLALVPAPRKGDLGHNIELLRTR